MVSLSLLLAFSLPSAHAACSVSALSPVTDATLTARTNFTFQMTTDCVSSTFSVSGVAGTKTPVFARLVGGRQLMVVSPSAANWASWTAPTKRSIVWKVTAVDAAGVSTIRGATAQLDLDADGYTRSLGDAGSCDAAASVNPGVVEVCDGVDNNCNGLIDDGAGTAWYADADGDGFGDAGVPTTACAAPVGYVSDGSDCNDADGGVSPAATELDNGIDDNCDGAVDEGLPAGDGEYGGHLYTLYRDVATWGDARMACEADGAHLVTLQDAAEDAFVMALVGGGPAWAGATDEMVEGAWGWVTGEPWSYTNWAPGEPNELGPEDYMVLPWGSGWNDLRYDSSEELGYVCEWE